jgi:hypothetical protein
MLGCQGNCATCLPADGRVVGWSSELLEEVRRGSGSNPGKPEPENFFDGRSEVSSSAGGELRTPPVQRVSQFTATYPAALEPKAR